MKSNHSAVCYRINSHICLLKSHLVGSSFLFRRIYLHSDFRVSKFLIFPKIILFVALNCETRVMLVSTNLNQGEVHLGL
ncbi:hypothetical protein SASPL_115868 [Salvia splendens]|uniref:Uncharacterized protein n=1 Tax=Salvia splendens TaxID=180675 RepID=A0A8X8Y8Y4_SALSN|nr:hypothetical protein SASPL_115868 [Salvia splendens]